MKSWTFGVMALAFTWTIASWAEPVPEIFTYQGRLSDKTSPAAGVYDLRFALCDAEAGGNVLIAITNVAVEVSDGLFTTRLDFGAGTFAGDARWLEIGVRTNGGTTFETLVPRQPLTPSPYALHALTAGTALQVPATHLTGTLSDSRLSTNVARLDGSATFAGTVTAAAFSGNGAGLGNLNAAALASGTVPNERLPSDLVRTGDAPVFTGVVTATSFQGAGAVPWQKVPVPTVQAEPNRGYVLDFPGLAVITLPAAPAFGDMVRIASAGETPWHLVQNEGQTILGCDIRGYGGLWTITKTAWNLMSIACSADGHRWIAAARNQPIYLSTNGGVSWTTSASVRSWNTVCSSADGLTLAAADVAGEVFISNDGGLNWTDRVVITSLVSIACSSDGTRLIAAGTGMEGGPLYTSTDSGTNWTICATASNRLWQSVASSADGMRLIAAADRIYTSSNGGSNWTARDTSRHWFRVASSADGMRLFAGVLNGNMYYSTNAGVTWVAGDSIRDWWSLACSADGTRAIAGAVSDGLYVLDAGSIWEKRLGAADWNSTACSADGRTLAAVSAFGDIAFCRPQTRDGTAGYLAGDANAAADLLYIDGGRWRILSAAGNISLY